MTKVHASDRTTKEFFEAKYRADIDPWDFMSSSHERSRYKVLLRALESRRYRCAFEPGCSIGVFTATLASICDRVEAIDISPTAVARAKAHCANYPHVRIQCGALPAAVPDCSFDLIVLNELAYYFTERQLVALLRKLRSKLDRHAVLFVSHWLGYSEDHVLSGDEVHQIVQAVMEVPPDLSQRHVTFRLDMWQVNA